MGKCSANPQTQGLVTHGLCVDCAHRFFAEMGMPLMEYIERLEAPILVVDASGTVRAANRRVRKLLQKDMAAIEGHKGGEVFECAHAGLPGGCGRTIHCSGCAIRRTVMDTFETGQSRLRVPAYLKRRAHNHLEEIQLLISTEKVDGAVLLRVDSFDGRENGQPES